MQALPEPRQPARCVVDVLAGTVVSVLAGACAALKCPCGGKPRPFWLDPVSEPEAGAPGWTGTLLWPAGVVGLPAGARRRRRAVGRDATPEWPGRTEGLFVLIVRQAGLQLAAERSELQLRGLADDLRWRGRDP